MASSSDARVAAVERRLEAVSAKMDGMVDTLAGVKTSNAVLEAKTDALQSSMDATRAAVERLTESIQTLVAAETVNKISREELASLRREVEELKAARWKLFGFATAAGVAGGGTVVGLIRSIWGHG